MKTSETIVHIATALAKAQQHIGAASKDSKNPFFKSAYADLGSVMAVCKQPLLDQGISVLQAVNASDFGTVLETILLHESGEYISSAMPIAVAKANDPQALGSAITYARRYALQSMVFIPAVDDDAEWAMKAMRNPEQDKPATSPMQEGNDRRAIQSMIDQRMEDAEHATGERRKELLGLASELRCKLADMDLEAAPEPPKVTRWQDVVCHVGQAGGKVLGKPLGELFRPGMSENNFKSLLAFFSKTVGSMSSPTNKDKMLWSAVLNAQAELFPSE